MERVDVVFDFWLNEKTARWPGPAWSDVLCRALGSSNATAGQQCVEIHGVPVNSYASTINEILDALYFTEKGAVSVENKKEPLA